MLRYLGVDAGEARIGLAVADDDVRLAVPIAVVKRHGKGVDWAARIVAEHARQREINVVIFGLPLNMDGSLGAQAKRAMQLGEKLKTAGDWQLEYWDERLSTFMAEHQVARTERTRHQAPRRRRPIDDAAAAIILQSYLDSHTDSAGNTLAAYKAPSATSDPQTQPTTESEQCDTG